MIFFLGQRTSRQAMVEDSGFLSNHNCTRYHSFTTKAHFRVFFIYVRFFLDTYLPQNRTSFMNVSKNCHLLSTDHSVDCMYSVFHNSKAPLIFLKIIKIKPPTAYVVYEWSPQYITGFANKLYKFKFLPNRQISGAQ